MLIGMIENALGWHLGPADRKAIRRDLQKQAKKAHRKSEWAGSAWLSEEPLGSESGFVSLLGHHLVFDGLREIPPTLSYDDLWARQAHRADDFVGGSRRYDARLERTVGLIRAGDVKLTSKSSATHADPESVAGGVSPGDSVFPGALKPQFPYYYVSPTPRGYVVPLGSYRFGASTTPVLSALIGTALDDPAAPLYLGSNDGWVEARWEVQ
jgi:CRISPR-associated protein Cas5